MIVLFENLADQHRALFVLALVFHVLRVAFVVVEAAAAVNQRAVVARTVNAIAAMPVHGVLRVVQRRCGAVLDDGEEGNILWLSAR